MAIPYTTLFTACIQCILSVKKLANQLIAYSGKPHALGSLCSTKYETVSKAFEKSTRKHFSLSQYFNTEETSRKV
jgi:hypothetical protein